MHWLFLLILFSTSGFADSTNDQDGSLNTNNVDSTVNSNNNTEDKSVSNVYNGAGSSSQMPVGSAIAPSYMSNGAETCLQGSAGSLQTLSVGIASGKYREDPHCNRRRDAKVLSDLGMKVAAVARMCESEDVWMSMFKSGTPCPLLANSKLVVGKRAMLMMKMNPELYIPMYGKVKYVKTAMITDKPPVARYTEEQKWFNQILSIGESPDVEESDDDMSISERFRSSLR